MSATVSKQVFATAMKVETTAGLPSMTVSTAALDRDMDRVIPQGGDFKAFQRNSVLLWAHIREALPIGAVVYVSADSSGIKIVWKWLENDPMADRIKNAWEQGIVRAASIGFISKKSTRNEYGGLDHLEWELLEISLVPVPANPTAVRTLKSLGLWGDSEPQQDGEIDWAAINRSAESTLDWTSINRSVPSKVEVNVTTEDVLFVVRQLNPIFREGLREGLRLYAQLEAERTINYMTGRLD